MGLAKAHAWSTTVLVKLGSFWQNTPRLFRSLAGPKSQKNSRELMRTKRDLPVRVGGHQTSLRCLT
jgi:hypothetical protein